MTKKLIKILFVVAFLAFFGLQLYLWIQADIDYRNEQKENSGEIHF